MIDLSAGTVPAPDRRCSTGSEWAAPPQGSTCLATVAPKNISGLLSAEKIPLPVVGLGLHPTGKASVPGTSCQDSQPSLLRVPGDKPCTAHVPAPGMLQETQSPPCLCLAKRQLNVPTACATCGWRAGLPLALISEPGSTPTMFTPPQPWAWLLGQCPAWLLPFFIPKIPVAGSQEKAHSLSPMRCTGRGHTMCSGFGKLMVFQVTGRISIPSPGIQAWSPG